MKITAIKHFWPEEKRLTIPAIRNISALAILFMILVWFTYRYLPVNEAWYYGIQRIVGTDWGVYFYPATQKVFMGKSPYTVSGVFNPPWTFFILAPFALFPEPLGRAIIFIFTFFVFGIVLRKFNPHPIGYVLAILSPFILRGAINTNIDWMIPLGMILPPWMGLFFVLSKPQIGIGIVIFWVYQSWKKGGYRELFRLLAPISVATLISFVIYGFWPLQMANIVSVDWNLSFWPYSISLGLALLAYALKKKDLIFSASASPFFAPYMNFHSYCVLLFATARSVVFSLILFLVSWSYMIATGDYINILISLNLIR